MGSVNVSVYESADQIYRTQAEYSSGANQALRSNFLQRSKFLFQSNDYQGAISDLFPEVAEVRSIVPVGGRTLNAHFVIKEPLAYVDAGNTRGIIDRQGVLVSLEDIDNTSLRVPLRMTSFDAERPIGSALLTVDEASLLQLIRDELKMIDHKVSAFDFDVESSRLTVRFDGKPYTARITTQSEHRQQVGTLKVALQALEGAEAPKEYVDVRVLGRVFVR